MLTVKLDPSLETEVADAAARQGLSKSEFVRQVLRQALQGRQPQKPTSWELMQRYAGKFESGDPELSTRRPRELIRQKYRAKHPD